MEQEKHFSFDLEQGLTEDERKANKKLLEYREEIANNETYNSTIHNFFENRTSIE